ncbi:MAG: hypothetical protein Q7R79_04835, partial [bacterium]|nr:hypothetical protein [bacterium]
NMLILAPMRHPYDEIIPLFGSQLATSPSKSMVSMKVYILSRDAVIQAPLTLSSPKPGLVI